MSTRLNSRGRWRHAAGGGRFSCFFSSGTLVTPRVWGHWMAVCPCHTSRTRGSPVTLHPSLARQSCSRDPPGVDTRATPSLPSAPGLPLSSLHHLPSGSLSYQVSQSANQEKQIIKNSRKTRIKSGHFQDYTLSAVEINT